MSNKEIANQFSGLPISELIGGPLMAACQAQSQLAHSTSNFIQTIGFEGDEGNKTVSVVNFKYNQLDGNGNTEQMSLDVPLLSVVKIPSLAIKTVDISFDMEVKSSTSEKTATEAKADFNAKAGWGPVSVSIKGSVSTAKENTRSTDNSAKYHINLHAADEGMPEGLSRVLDILNSVIVPTKKEPVT